MDRAESLRVFCTVAEASSFTKAARRLGMSGPSVTRAVAALEEHLGVRLLARTTRAVRTTAVGERFLVDAKQIVLSMTDAEAKARGHHGSLEGPVSVTGSVTFGNMHVAPVVLEFLRAHRR